MFNSVSHDLSHFPTLVIITASTIHLLEEEYPQRLYDLKTIKKPVNKVQKLPKLI